MKEQHTPGPWTSRGAIPFRSQTADYCVIANGGFVVAETFQASDQTQNALANAHLIAAAPDLLEACESILIAQFELNWPAIQMLRNAVSKARGF